MGLYPASLPIKRDLSQVTTLSWMIALGMGAASLTSLLFQASMLFIGLLAFFLLLPMVAGVPFPMEDFVVILVMGLICFVPFALFVRGVLSKGRP